MALTTVVPILPGFAPGRNPSLPLYPVRGPGWSIKQTQKWNNVRQQSVSGRTMVVKYWSAPLWEWEWIYDVILDDPRNQNPYYNNIIPYTDFQILNGFVADRQGGGNEFAFQPPDSVIGGTFNITSVTSANNNYWTFGVTNNTIQAGLWGVLAGLSTAAFLNGSVAQILASTPNSITMYIVHAGTFNNATETGTVWAGQQFAPEDGNFNTAFIHGIGGYAPLPQQGNPVVTTQVTEPVQIVDNSTLVVWTSTGGFLSPTNFSIVPANTVAGYPGLVLNFSANGGGQILASFNYYYLCRFTEDTQEFDNFMAMLWSTGSFKFEQVRI